MSEQHFELDPMTRAGGLCGRLVSSTDFTLRESEAEPLAGRLQSEADVYLTDHANTLHLKATTRCSNASPSPHPRPDSDPGPTPAPSPRARPTPSPYPSPSPHQAAAHNLELPRLPSAPIEALIGALHSQLSAEFRTATCSSCTPQQHGQALASEAPELVWLLCLLRAGHGALGIPWA